MARIHIVTPTLTPYDAVANDVFGMLGCLRLKGHQASTYAENIDPVFRELAQPVTAYEEFISSRNDILIYQHSVGWSAGSSLFARSRNRKVLRYQSVTPSRFFRSFSSVYTERCRRGELQTYELLGDDPDLLMPSSAFTALELEQAGGDRNACQVVPPFHAIGELDALSEDALLAERLQGGVNVVFVGRLAPNKGHLHLLRALAHYRTHFCAEAQLYLIGKIDDWLGDYLEELRAEISWCGLNEAVHFTGPVTPRQLKTYYAHASLFLCASEHEGFCVPLVEAMYYGVPIVAYGSTAVAATMGEDGLVWDTPNAALLAESMDQVLTRPEVKEGLVRRQRKRFESQFTREAIGRALDQAIAPLLATC